MTSLHENPNFRNFIRSLLDKAIISKEKQDILTDHSGMIEFTNAFTHKEIDPINNYEYHEILGDVVANLAIVTHYHKRFSYLFKKGGSGVMGPVGIMARLKMTGISKKTYSQFSDKLGLWDYIRVPSSEEQEKQKRDYFISKRKVLEDVFEAFIGCLCKLIDERLSKINIDGQIFELNGIGFSRAYDLMEPLMKEINIEISEENIYDEKSKLNNEIGKIHWVKLNYISEDRFENDEKLKEDKSQLPTRFKTYIIIQDKNTNNIIYTSGIGYGINKKDSEQKAAKMLRESGILNKLYERKF